MLHRNGVESKVQYRAESESTEFPKSAASARPNGGSLEINEKCLFCSRTADLSEIFYHSCFTAVSSVCCSSLHLLSADLFLRCAVFVLASEGTAVRIVPCTLSSPAAEGIGAELCRVCGDQKSTMNESSSARAGGKHMVKWSTNENGKLLPLVGPVQVHASGERRSGHDGCPVSPPLLI